MGDFFDNYLTNLRQRNSDMRESLDYFRRKTRILKRENEYLKLQIQKLRGRDEKGKEDSKD